MNIKAILNNMTLQELKAIYTLNKKEMEEISYKVYGDWHLNPSLEKEYNKLEKENTDIIDIIIKKI